MCICTFFRTAACALAALSASTAQAAHPLLTDDAGVLDAGACEVETIADRSRVTGARAEGLSLAAGCGVGGRSQVGVAWARARADGASADAAALGGKTSLWPGDDGAPALSVGWSLAWDRADGQGWKRASTDLALLLTTPLGADLSLHANLGHARDHAAGRSATGWGVALEHAPVALGPVAVAPMGELAGDDRDAPWWNLGLRATLAEDRAWLSISYGRQMDGQRASLATLGLKLAF